jgi:hypothetical protein
VTAKNVWRGYGGWWIKERGAEHPCISKLWRDLFKADINLISHSDTDDSVGTETDNVEEAICQI